MRLATLEFGANRFEIIFSDSGSAQWQKDSDFLTQSGVK